MGKHVDTRTRYSSKKEVGFWAQLLQLDSREEQSTCNAYKEQIDDITSRLNPKRLMQVSFSFDDVVENPCQELLDQEQSVHDYMSRWYVWDIQYIVKDILNDMQLCELPQEAYMLISVMKRILQSKGNENDQELIYYLK